MSVWIEDSPRTNLAGWILESHQSGFSTGAVITPFATPWVQPTGQGKKPSASKRIQQLRNAGVTVWFDPTTHALQMDGVGDFRFYDEYSLWTGDRGNLDTTASQSEHVRRVFDVQRELGTPPLAPTVLLHAALSTSSQHALDLSRIAVESSPKCWISIAGTSSFWRGGLSLDAHIGALSALQPGGYFITTVRPTNATPPEATAEEIHGLCRTVRALSEDVPVHISHGDLASLPAVAAGAASVGSGWDRRQRVCSYVDYSAREENGGGGAWFKRPTFRGLLGSLSTSEAEVLRNSNPALTSSLGGLPAPSPKEAFLHHVSALRSAINDIASGVSYQQRFHNLMSIYTEATANWSEVKRITSSPLDHEQWISELHAGLRLYGATEGWQ